MSKGSSLFAIFELDRRTGYLRAIFTSAQDDEQFGVVKRALGRICRPNSFGWIKRLIRFAGRG
jgi:hypothetical protein